MSDLWSSDLVSRIIEGFPYKEQFCPFCDSPLKILKAVHITDMEEIFKAIYGCDNPRCEVFDLEAKKAYIKVYYSDPLAIERFETYVFKFGRRDLDRGTIQEVL